MTFTSAYDLRKKYKSLVNVINTDAQDLRRIYKHVVDEAFNDGIIPDTERDAFYREIDNGLYDENVISFIWNFGVWYSSIGEVIMMLKEAKTQEEV